CPLCRSTGPFETNLSAGTTICGSCYTIVEQGILVSEIGFGESAGGRVHVQGQFVSRFATGIAGIRGASSASSEKAKQDGQAKVKSVGDAMNIEPHIIRGAQRWYGLAVDNRFNRGRRIEYIVASCLYLQCRMKKDPHMLIDFSERLTINVYELGGTYLKLRSILSLTETMPEVDPAIYNLRFANRLSFGAPAVVHAIAADASKLIRRFAADWMTQGRRPAGLCGACLIIAARMHDFLRTPDEVAQVVKVAPITIHRRLREFAQTSIAKKTVEEWRNMTEEDLLHDTEDVPPVVKKQREQARKLAEKVKRETAMMGQEESSPPLEELDPQDDDDMTDPQGEGSTRRRGKERMTEEELDMGEVIREVAENYGLDVFEGEEIEDPNLEEMGPTEYTKEVDAARDDPDQAKSERKRDQHAFRRSIPSSFSTTAVDSDPTQSTLVEYDALGLEDKEEDLQEYDEDEKEDDDEKEEGQENGKRNNKKKNFDEWEDEEATMIFLEKTYFSEEARLLAVTGTDIRERIKSWLRGREPKDVVMEMRTIENAYRKRAKGAKVKEDVFEDIDDEELDKYWIMDDHERDTRARMWLSSNGKWLEEEKTRQEKKALEEKRKGESGRPKPKTKRKRPTARQKPFTTAREAITTLAIDKKFSSRVNYDALESAVEKVDSELVMFDDKEDEGEKYDDDDDDGKYDDGEKDDGDDEEEEEWGGKRRRNGVVAFNVTDYGGQARERRER
ncbi:hypothetical protein TREMEDRAFT_35498, partial [Tremella mesenterica DSM 1558]|uniref:uncharacterized protein n=1 Tax=Tremella mesenterica (strain ATCC 24925 / CBS 8224 / DSM 1558 / NBRC 9311 / NRRL Y-6157 / RJB 2259-6 / UBC 559-6) TaxID=578456 RepID=UPI00032D4FA1